MDQNLIVYEKVKVGLYHPLYLNEEHKEAIRETFQYLGDAVNERYYQVEKNYPEYLVNEIKLSRAMKAVIIGTFFVAKRKINLEIDLLSLRSRLFELINQKNSFISSTNPSDRKNVLNQLKKEFGIKESIELIEEYLFSDHQENLIFTLKSEFPTPDEVIDEFNRQLVNAIIRSANKVTLLLTRGLTGQEYRGVHYISSRSGLYTEFSHIFDSDEDKIKNFFQISVSIPDELIGRRFVAANKLIIFFHYIWKKYQNFMVDLPVIYSNYRKKEVVIDIQDLKPWFPKEATIVDKQITFDSTTEKIFYEKLLKVPYFYGEVQRDAEIILVPDGTIIIPDFQINYYNHSIFIEVVGFWTNNYKTRKLKKLNQLPKDWQDRLILLVDEKLNFPKTNYPTFIYRNNKFKMKEIMNYLINTWQKPIYENKVKEVKDRLSLEMIEHFKENFLLKLEEFAKIFGLSNLKEAESILNELANNNEFEKFSLIKTPNNILIKKEKLESMIQEIKKSLSKKGEFPVNKRWLLNDLSKNDNFKNIKMVGIDFLLSKANYRIEYQNLVNVLIYRI